MEDLLYKPNMDVVRTARAFIRSLCEVYGTDQGMSVWDEIRRVLGERAAGDIFLGMLVGHADRVRVLAVGPHKIEAIKEIRHVSGLGLKEAKDFFEAVADLGPRDLDVSKADEAKIADFILNMRRIGCKVE